jgi:hypothetical protein
VILLPTGEQNREVKPSRCDITSRCTYGLGVQDNEPSLAQLRLSKRHTQGGFGARLRIEGYHNRLGLSDMAGMPATGNHDERTVHPWRDL